MGFDCNKCKNKKSCEEASENNELVKCNYEPTETEVLEFFEDFLEREEKQKQIDYVIKLNVAYINKIGKTKDISKKQALRYIKEHLIASTRSFVNWEEVE